MAIHVNVASKPNLPSVVDYVFHDRRRSYSIEGTDAVKHHWQRPGASRDNVRDNRVAGIDFPFQSRKNPPLRFMVLLSDVVGSGFRFW